MEFVEFELRSFRSYCQPSSVVIELFVKIVVKPDEEVAQGFTTITVSCQDVCYSNTIIFQSHRYYSEVMSECSEEIIIETSEE